MGYMQRQREEAERLHVETYRVKRWTAFEWTVPDGQEMREWRKEREDHLKRAAGMVLRKLRDMCPDGDPAVTQVRVGGKPELLFELTVRATDENDARKRAMYRFGRGLSVRIPAGGGRKVTLSPPWGKVEVKVQRPNSSRKAKAAA